MTDVDRCPGCGGELPGLATYCHRCKQYVADMVGPPPTRSHPTDGIPDTRSEEQIQLAVRRALELLGYHVSDLSQGRPTRQTPGIPDLWVMGTGCAAWMEVKREDGRLSAEQQAWHSVAARAGVSCIVVRSEADAIAWHERREVA